MVLALALTAANLSTGVLGTGCGRTHEGSDAGGSGGSGGSAGGVGNPGSAGSASDSAHLDLARAQCAYLERCDPDALHRFSKSSITACSDYFRCHLDRGRASRIFRDGDTLDTCIDSLLSRSCPDAELEPVDRFSYGTDTTEIFPWGPACLESTLEQPLAPPPDAPEQGQACLGYGERAPCANGSYCELEDVPRFGMLRCGLCRARLPLGESCEESGQCIEGSVCALSECQPQRLPGDPCSSSEQCRFRNCEAGICGRSEYAPTPYADALGQACEGASDCGNQAALACVDQRCRALSDLGESCAAVPCRRGLTCVNDECIDLGCSVDPGEPCQDFCTLTLCVDGTCQSLPDREGQPCTIVCDTGLTCLEGRCEKAQPRTNGAGCDYDRDCDTGFCNRNLSEYCSRGSCTIPSCDRCGTCADLPEPSDCE